MDQIPRSLSDFDGKILLYLFSFLDLHSVCDMAVTSKKFQILANKNLLREIAKIRAELIQLGHPLRNALIFQIIKLKKKDLSAAKELLLEYAAFRKEEFDKHPDPEGVLKKEASSHKAFWYGTDKAGRPCLIIRPKFHAPHKKNYTLLYAIDMFEHACEIVLNHEDVHDFCVILDFKGFGAKNFDLNFARTFITWSRKYYKNLLGACYCVRSPKYALWCWTLVKIFVPAETLKKILISKDKDEAKTILMANFEPEQLPECYGGIAKLAKRFDM